jgi:predicted nucleotide-binding protein
VFIVHGHDSPAKIEVARVIDRAGLKAVILHEQPNAGRTIIEKFEAPGGSAGFAVVVLTPDDVGGPRAAPGEQQELRPRARQNVIGEMFWFAGKLGRGSVCALKKGEIEMPSDFAGVADSRPRLRHNSSSSWALMEVRHRERIEPDIP